MRIIWSLDECVSEYIVCCFFVFLLFDLKITIRNKNSHTLHLVWKINGLVVDGRVMNHGVGAVVVVVADDDCDYAYDDGGDGDSVQLVPLSSEYLACRRIDYRYYIFYFVYTFYYYYCCLFL